MSIDVFLSCYTKNSFRDKAMKGFFSYLGFLSRTRNITLILFYHFLLLYKYFDISQAIAAVHIFNSYFQLNILPSTSLPHLLLIFKKSLNPPNFIPTLPMITFVISKSLFQNFDSIFMKKYAIFLFKIKKLTKKL